VVLDLFVNGLELRIFGQWPTEGMGVSNEALSYQTSG